VNLKAFVLVALVVGVATVVAVRYWPGDERDIRKQIGQLETLGSKEADEKPIESLVRARKLAALFHDPCTLQVESADFQGEYGRQQIQERIAMARGFYTEAKVSVHDLVLERAENNTARIRCTLRVKGRGKSQPIADVQELAAGLRKKEGDWLFTTVTLVEVLER
jgi:hypothetical protein